ncbi:MAG: PfkB family carbohydrate kinase [Candidatus Bathyarchaeota archaeon]
MYDLVAIGNPVYDEIITPYVKTDGRVLSGCSTNACLAAKKLGLGRVALIGSLGKDYEATFKTHMARYGIEVPHVKVSENTGGFRLIYDNRGDRTLDVLGIADKIFPEDIPGEYLEAKVILIAPILQEVNIDLIRFLKEGSHATLFLDPQGLIREISKGGRIAETCERSLAAEFTGMVDIIKPNERESVVLTGFEDPYTSARQLVEWGARIGIITLADKGSIIRRGKGYVRIPAYRTVAKDPTGAGDTYAGAFIKKYLENESLLSCGLFASAAASIKVEHTGSDFPLTEDYVTQRARELNSPG